MKTIAHIIPSLGCGGLEKVVISQIRSLRENFRHVVIVITNDDFTLETEVPDDVKVHRLNKKPGKDILAHVRLLRILQGIRPDIVSTYNFGAIEYHFISKIAGVRKNIHVDHGFGGDHPYGKNLIHNLFRKFIQHFIDNYIVVSRDLMYWAANDIGIPTRKIHLIPNGIVSPVPNEVKAHEFNPLQFTIITVGRLVDIKNQKFMIEHTFELAKTKPAMRIRLVIVGDGDLRTELENQAAKYSKSISNLEIIFLGLQHKPWEVAATYKPDLFLLTSKYEAMPLTIMEAMLREIPVAASSVGGIPEVLSSDLYYGFDLNSKSISEALERAISESISGYIEQRAEQAKNFVTSHYGFERFLESYSDVWDTKNTSA